MSTTNILASNVCCDTKVRIQLKWMWKIYILLHLWLHLNHKNTTRGFYFWFSWLVKLLIKYFWNLQSLSKWFYIFLTNGLSSSICNESIYFFYPHLFLLMSSINIQSKISNQILRIELCFNKFWNDYTMNINIPGFNWLFYGIKFFILPFYFKI